MKKKFQLFLLNSCLFLIGVLLVAFHYSKNEEQTVSLSEAIEKQYIKLNYITSIETNCLETIILNNTNSHLKINIPKGTLLKIVSKRFLFLKVLENEIIEINPHSTVEQLIIGKCFQKKNKKR